LALCMRPLFDRNSLERAGTSESLAGRRKRREASCTERKNFLLLPLCLRPPAYLYRYAVAGLLMQQGACLLPFLVVPPNPPVLRACERTVLDLMEEAFVSVLWFKSLDTHVCVRRIAPSCGFLHTHHGALCVQSLHEFLHVCVCVQFRLR